MNSEQKITSTVEEAYFQKHIYRHAYIPLTN